MHKLRLVDGWKSANSAGYDSGAPSYGVGNGVVYLSGGMFQPVQGKAKFATLPAGDRPSTNLFITVSVEEGETNFGTLFISPKGVMEVYTQDGANTRRRLHGIVWSLVPAGVVSQGNPADLTQRVCSSASGPGREAQRSVMVLPVIRLAASLAR